MDRYARHKALHEFSDGLEERIHEGTVAVIGAGGVASTTVLYLAAAGVKCLILFDFDKVDITNLQRQVIHTEDRVGVNKAESAAATARRLNSSVEFVVIKEKFSRETAAQYLSRRTDCIVDTTDIPEMRFLAAEIAYKRGIALVHAAAVRFTVTCTTVLPGYKALPCLRCLYRNIPPKELRQSGSHDGIFGPAAGAAGCLAAAEALKLLAYRGDKAKLPSLVLAGRLKIIQMFDMESRTISYVRKSDCPLCSDIYDDANDAQLIRNL